VIKTPLGDIPVQLYPNMAPQTVANFRAYADSGDWNGSLVHRSVPGFVIQGGGYREVGGAYQTIPTDPPVPNEPVSRTPPARWRWRASAASRTARRASGS
jgi:cyclophilin family peptidyl-prolyl cis-trans isomerase